MRSNRWSRVGLSFLAIFLALSIGLVSAFLPAWLVISALVVPAVAVLMFLRPEYALLALLALACGLIHPAFVPRVPFLGGSISAKDFVLIMLTVYATFLLAEKKGEVEFVPVAGIRWLVVSLGFYGVWFIFSVTMSLWVKDLAPPIVLAEARRLIYLIALPIAVIILRQPDRQQRFVVGVVLLGCLLSLGQILQGVLNIPVFGSQYMSSLGLVGDLGDSTTRAITLGINEIVYSLLLTVGAYVLGLIRRSLFFAVAGLLLIGIFLTYGRTTYASVLICLIIVISWLNFGRLPRLAGALVIMITVGFAFGMLWKPDSLEAVIYRVTTVDKEIDYGYSARWRIWEAEAMLPHIAANPLTGIGLGADYWNSRSSDNPELNRYMHNGYLYMAGKMGLPALILFLSLMAAIFAIGRRSAKSHASAWTRFVGAAGAALMVHFAFSSITEPHFMSDPSIVNIAIAGALVYLSARRRVPLTVSTTVSGAAAGAKHPVPYRHTDAY
jgi:O-antigen ligase